jgi:hypothetical protein
VHDDRLVQAQLLHRGQRKEARSNVSGDEAVRCAAVNQKGKGLGVHEQHAVLSR